MKNLVLRRAFVFEVDQSGIGAANGSGSELALGRRLYTFLLHVFRRRVLEVEPVIAVDVGKDIL